MSDSLADMKARVARASESAREATTVEVLKVEGGMTFWKVGTAVVLTPTMSENAPKAARRWQRDRVICNATGECPRCGAVASVTSKTRGAFLHESHCNLGGDIPRKFEKWIDLRAAAAIGQVAGQLEV